MSCRSISIGKKTNTFFYPLFVLLFKNIDDINDSLWSLRAKTFSLPVTKDGNDFNSSYKGFTVVAPSET
jgi:hypothetical protein